MTLPDICPDCPGIERRKGERRQVVQRTFAFCAKFVAFTTVVTSIVSIGAAVSISAAITERVHREHEADMQTLRDWDQDMQTRILKLEAQ